MKKHNVKILESFFVTHDVKSFIVERPEDYMFEPGQATEVSINKNGWKEEKRPFTFTNLPEDNFLQFIIKSYPEHKGVTKEIHTLNVGDELILHDVF
ncbi:MAG: flavodoxin reductase, partial [Bacteroidetes bacterium]|nr:flavodoxin reductase [Bacteroidota bacterium]